MDRLEAIRLAVPRRPKEKQKVDLGVPLGAMTLRDYFAAQVLMGMHARERGQGTPIQRAKIAYADAEAMLAVRQKG